MHLVKIWSDSFICLTTYQYKQFHNGIEVEHAEFREHVDKTNGDSVVALSQGDIVEGLNVSATPSILESTALDSALFHMDVDSFLWESDSAEFYLREYPISYFDSTYYPKGLLIITINDTLEKEPSNYKLTWKFPILAMIDSQLHSEIVYVDAHDGSIVKRENAIHDNGTFNHVYHGARNDLDTRQINGDFYTVANDVLSGNTQMRDIWTTDDLNTWTARGMAKDDNDVWGNDHWGATSAHWVIQKSWKLWEFIYGRQGGPAGPNGTNTSGTTLQVFVGNEYNRNGAYWERSTSRIYFVRDRNNPGPFLGTLDIGGHEFTHGVVQNTANLGNSHESGALNESFADIFGMLTERLVFPSSFNWTIGENTGSTIRDIQTPSNMTSTIDGVARTHPEIYDGPNWVDVSNCRTVIPNTNDQCFTHVNCGVQNKWFNLLSIGGTTTVNGNVRVVNGIGIDKAGKIAFTSLTRLSWAGDQNYLKARANSIAAARVLYGSCSDEERETCKAWFAVNVGNNNCEPCIEWGPETVCYWCNSSGGTVAPLNTEEFRRQTKTISVYPNPASNYLEVSLPEMTREFKVNHGIKFEIVDLQGKLISVTSPNINDFRHTIDITQLTPGLYVIRCSGAGYMTSVRFLKK